MGNVAAFNPRGTYHLVDNVPSAGTPMTMNFQTSVNPATSPDANSQSDSFNAYQVFKIGVDSELAVQEGSISLKYQGLYLTVTNNDQLVQNYDPVSGDGPIIGSINWATGVVTITNGALSGTTVELITLGGLVLPNLERLGMMFGRTPGSPLVPGQFTVSAEPHDGGNRYTGEGDNNGDILGDYVRGEIDYATGSFYVKFGEWVVDDAAAQSEIWYNANDNDGGGNVWKPYNVVPDDVVFNCVVTSYLPLDADLLGLNPVRLPIDGKVPIFRDGSIILIHHSEQETCPSPLSADQVVTLSRSDVSLIELYDQNGIYVPETDNYTVDLVAGTITMANPLDLAAYTEPLVALHRIEDMCLASDVQVTGHMSITSPITHDYPDADTLVSTVLPAGDLQSRVYNEFFQDTWNSEWSDNRDGDEPTAKYDLLNYPIITTNRDAVQERFACILQSSNTVMVVGEHLGVIYNGTTGSDISPINPQTGSPYFTIRTEGWGVGWNAGEVFRFNLAGAGFPYWYCRTTLQGPPTENSDDYIVQLRGDST